MNGYIYIASSDFEPFLLKIGMTVRNPADRVQQLNSTGIIYPLILRKYYWVTDAQSAKRMIYERLPKKQIRHNREFFVLSLQQADNIISAVITSNRLSNNYKEQNIQYKGQNVHNKGQNIQYKGQNIQTAQANEYMLGILLKILLLPLKIVWWVVKCFFRLLPGILLFIIAFITAAYRKPSKRKFLRR